MNKKIALIFLFPLLASCSGLPVSRDDALNILNAIEKDAISDTSYTSKVVTETKESRVELVSIFSKENKFYHTYTIETRFESNFDRVNEAWRFKKAYVFEDGTSEDFIFNVIRDNHNLNQELEKQYVVTYEKYSDDAWDKYATDYKNSLSRRFQDAIEHSRELIKDNTNSITLQSLNSNSLHLDFKQAVEGSETHSTQYQLDVTDNLLYSIKTVSSESTVTTTYSYATGDILYPGFKITIAKNSN